MDSRIRSFGARTGHHGGIDQEDTVSSPSGLIKISEGYNGRLEEDTEELFGLKETVSESTWRDFDWSQSLQKCSDGRKRFAWNSSQKKSPDNEMGFIQSSFSASSPIGTDQMAFCGHRRDIDREQIDQGLKAGPIQPLRTWKITGRVRRYHRCVLSEGVGT